MPIVIVIAYVCISLLTACISGVLSYYGLLSTAHAMTPWFVAAIMSVVLLMGYTISYFRMVGRRIALLIVIFFMAASLSIASNFNFLYTNFMRESVTEETVSAELEVFRDDLVETRARILSMDSVRRATERKTELDMEIRDLVEQGTDPLRPGCGERCREHMANIEAIIGRPLTDFAVPQIGASSEVMSEWLTRYSAAAEETFLTSLGNSSVPALTNLAERIEATLSEFPTADIVVEQRNGLEALKDMKSLSEDYEREANALLPETMQVDHEPIDPTLGRLGEIAYSLENGFVDWPNPAATVLSLFLASIVDILPLMLSFALFGPGRLERKGNAPSVRGNRGATVVSSSSIR